MRVEFVGCFCGEARRSVKPALKPPKVCEASSASPDHHPLSFPLICTARFPVWLDEHLLARPNQRPISVGQDADELAVGGPSANQAREMPPCWVPAHSQAACEWLDDYTLRKRAIGCCKGGLGESLLQGLILPSQFRMRATSEPRSRMTPIDETSGLVETYGGLGLLSLLARRARSDLIAAGRSLHSGPRIP